MNVLILSSASTDIDPYYVDVARKVSNYLANNGFDLVFGGASFSMMGACYQEFVNAGRDVYAFTTLKYKDDLDNLPNAKHYVRETTFDMKKAMFENSDLIVVLPGGYGTLSELLSYIEENRSNDKNVPIEIYDEDYFYETQFQMFNIMKERAFSSSDINDLVGVSHNKDEFNEHIGNYLVKKRRI